ncbi:MAG: hypothetical protein LC804_26040 [Acidobacteria bacterium]|nr:hypothetical protein [Acidobacteriota bacterium]
MSAIVRRHLLLLRAELHLAHFHVVFRPLQRFARREAALPQFLLSFQVVLGLPQRHARAFHGFAQLVSLRPRCGQ